jgi:hypothetical protein
MSWLVRIGLLCCSVALSACIKFEFGDGTTTTSTAAKTVREGASLADPKEQAEFERRLSEAGVPFEIETRHGDRFAYWSEEHSVAANRAKASVIGEPLPHGRNISFSPPEQQERFKAWLEENSIPYKTQISRGREFVVWDEANTEKVESWKHYGKNVREAPNPSIERTSPGKPGAASHVKR